MPRGSGGGSGSGGAVSQAQLSFHGVEQSLQIMRQVKSYFSVGMDHVLEVAADMAEFGMGEEEQASSLLKTMLSYLRMERDMNNFMTATNNVVRQGADCEEKGGLLRMLDEQLVELSKTNDDEVLKSHDMYEELEQKIWDSHHPDATRNILGVGTPSEEEGIEIMFEEVCTRCPYTGKEMVDPVFNTICKHAYDNTGILQYIEQRGMKAMCPVGGCSNKKPITAKDLEDHKEMRRYIHNRAKHSQASGSSQVMGNDCRQEVLRPKALSFLTDGQESPPTLRGKQRQRSQEIWLDSEMEDG